jgi:hypothetical protein
MHCSCSGSGSCPCSGAKTSAARARPAVSLSALHHLAFRQRQRQHHHHHHHHHHTPFRHTAIYPRHHPRLPCPIASYSRAVFIDSRDAQSGDAIVSTELALSPFTRHPRPRPTSTPRRLAVCPAATAHEQPDPRPPSPARAVTLAFATTCDTEPAFTKHSPRRRKPRKKRDDWARPRSAVGVARASTAWRTSGSRLCQEFSS